MNAADVLGNAAPRGRQQISPSPSQPPARALPLEGLKLLQPGAKLA